MDEEVKTNIILGCSSEEPRKVQAIIMSLEGGPQYVEYCKVAMFEACRVGSANIVEYLVHTSHSDCIINCTDVNGETPLHVASKLLNVKVCRTILETGACHVNAQSISGQTPLHLAIEAENGEEETKLEIARLLLSFPFFDRSDSWGATPFDIAQKGDAQNSVVLLDKGRAEGHAEIEQGIQRGVITAVDAKDVQKVNTSLTSQHCDPDVKTSSGGDTPLIIACKRTTISIVRLLLTNKNCDINAQNYDGNTALHFAVAGHSLEAIICLVSHKMYKPNLANKLGETPLHVACTCVNVQAVTEILKNRYCNVNLQTSMGQTPIHLAVGAECGDLESKVKIIQLILAISDCDPNIRNCDQETPLIVACKHGNWQTNIYVQTISALLSSQRCDPNCQNSDGDTALHLATNQGNRGAIEALVCCINYKPNLSNEIGHTPLHTACSELNITAVEVLIKQGMCNVNAQSSTGQTPLHLAIIEKVGHEPKLQEDIAQLLLSVPDCDPYIADAQGITPLQIAHKTNLKVVMLILEKECAKGYSMTKQMIGQAVKVFRDDPNLRSGPDGDTALITACKMGFIQIIYVLLSFDNCDITIRNYDGNTALHFAVAGHFPEVLIICMVSHKLYKPNLTNKLSETPLHIACAHLNVPAVTAMLKNGYCNVNLQTSTGQTSLHLAVESEIAEVESKVEIVEALLAIPDCDPNITNSDGDTALIVACKSLHPQHYLQIILALLSCDKWDPNVKNDDGNTALHYAAAQNSLEIVKALVRCETYESDLTNIVGATPLHIACSRINEQAITFFLTEGNCDVNAQTSSDKTPLHLVITALDVSHNEVSYIKIVRALVSDEKYDPNIQDNDGNTGLHLAAMEHKQSTIKSLVYCAMYKPDVTNKLGQTPLHISCSQLDKAAIKVLLMEGDCSVNVQTSIGQTPLHLVLTTRMSCEPKLEEDIIRLLLSIPDCDPHIADAQGVTPLQIAYKPKVFRLLLEMGCEVGYPKTEQMLEQAMALCNHDLLSIAARWKGTRILQSCLKFLHSLPKVMNKPESTNGYTPLATAVRKANLKAVELLLMSHYCDPNVKSGIEGDTPLIVACRKTVEHQETLDIQIIYALLSHEMCDHNAQNIEGNTALHFTVAGTCQEAVEALVFHDKYEPDIVNHEGETPLHIACTNLKIQAVKALLEVGRCNINLQTSTGETPLHLVNRAVGNLETKETIVHLLLNVSNCDPHIADAKGVTPVQVVMHRSSIELAILMLEKGCAEGYSKTEEMIDQAMAWDDSDLFHLVIHSKKTGVVRCILDNLKSVKRIINKPEAASRDTPLGIAVRAGSAEIVKVLLHSQNCDPDVRTGIHGETPLIVACKMPVENQGLKVIQALLSSSKCNINLQDFIGNTALHYASAGNSPATVNALVCNEKYQPDVVNNQGETPLHAACSSLNVTIATMIIKDGKGNVNMQTNNGQTPLHLVVRAFDDSTSKEQLVCLLLSHPDCDPHITDTQGVPPVQLAYNKGEMKLFRLLLEKGSSKAYSNKEHMIKLAMILTNNTLLHLSCYWESSILVRGVLESVHVSPHLMNHHIDIIGGTPLQISIIKGNSEIAAFLLAREDCDPNVRNSDGQTPLWMAVAAGNCGLVETLLFNEQCDPNLKNNFGDTALHIAVSAGKQGVVVALLHNNSCNPNIQNSSGETPLHVACKLGNFDIVTALTESKHCDINIPDNIGRTALHRAVHYMIPGQVSIFKHLIADSRCELTACDFRGNTALHLACSKAAWRQDESIVTVIRMLLSTGKVSPQCVNNAGETPIQLAISNDEVVHVLSSFSKAQVDHPVQTFVKIFVIGNAETGKSSLVESVCADAFIGRRFVPPQFKTVKGVRPHTAGIVPIPVNNRHFGNAVIYDFAGQHQYYSSHAAVLENLVLSSPPVFLLTVNLSEPFDKICETVAYWWSFISSYTTRSSSSPHVIIIGSHKDVVKSRGEKVQAILDRLLATMKEIPTKFSLVGYVMLDCRIVASEGLTNLLTMLKHTCETVRKNVKIDLRCHILSSFLSDTLSDHLTCTLADILASIKAEENTLLPQSTPDLVNLLAALSDKDRILLLTKTEDLENSWIILQRQKLYGDINGSIFAPDYFHEYVPDFAGNTGIVPVSKLSKHFPHYPQEVLTGFLLHLQFCFKIGDAQTLELITTEEGDFAPDEEFYFFPALVNCDTPPEHKVWDPTNTYRHTRRRYGWLYECAHRYQYLMSRFLHVLILRLAFSYALAMENEPSHNLPVVRRRCSVWKRGLAWRNNDGLETVVEVGLQNQWVVVMMQSPVGKEAECTHLRRSVIKTVLDAKQEFCPEVTMNEYLMHPGITDYPFQRTKQLALYSMKEVCKVMIEGKDYVLDKAGMHQSALAELLPCEPYVGLGRKLVTQLFMLKYAQEVMTDHCLSDFVQRMIHSNPNASQHKLKLFTGGFLPSDEVLFPLSGTNECADRCLQLIQRAKPMTFDRLSKMLDKFSILCGRNPWDISELTPATEVLEGGFISSELRQCLEQIDDSLLGIESLLKVRTEVAPAVGHSASLCLALGLSQAPTLQVIQHNWPDDVAFQLTEIMAAWLQDMGNSTWRTLAKALLNPMVDCPVVARAIMEQHTKDNNSVEPSDDSKAVDEAPLTESFPVDILPAVVQGGHFSWFHLGLVLGLHYGTLKIIQIEHSSHTECVAVVITKWLNQVDSVGRRGQPSWRVLAKALAHPLVGQHRLADDIARDHPAQEVSDTSGNVTLPEPASLHSSESHQPMRTCSPSPSPPTPTPPTCTPTPPASSHSSSPAHSSRSSPPSPCLPHTSFPSATQSPPPSPSLSNQ